MQYKKRWLSPEDYHKDICHLALILKRSAVQYKYVYGIPRGGTPIAVYLSHRLGYRYIEAFNAVPESIKARREDFLIVDDISHTGETLQQFEGYPTATLFYRPESSVKPKHFVHEVEEEYWVVFPYEKENEVPNR
jgi:hypoxanthine phosphoribosyltransferase